MTDTALQSIELIPEQIKQAWTESTAVSFPEQYKKIQSVVITGMGGSAYSYYVLSSLFSQMLPVPLMLSNSYHLPAFVNDKTLVIGSSFSGSTEETIQATTEALEKGVPTTAVTAGGRLSQLLTGKQIPHYKFDPKHNPSGQPRMGQGYMVVGTLGILYKLGLLPRLDITQFQNPVLPNLKKVETKARELEKKFVGKIPVFVGSEHLNGNAHIIRNQTNETAKNFAAYSVVPELNHHLMEGLKNPKDNNLLFVFFESSLYSGRIQKRMTLTREVVEKNNIPTVSYKAEAGTPFMEFVEVLTLGGYLTYFLAQTYGENPNSIPWVDYFKDKLAS